LAIQLFGKHYWPSDKFIRFGAEIGGQPNEIGHVIRKNKNHSLVKLLWATAAFTPLRIIGELSRPNVNQAAGGGGEKRSNLGNIEGDLPLCYCPCNTLRMSNAKGARQLRFLQAIKRAWNVLWTRQAAKTN